MVKGLWVTVPVFLTSGRKTCQESRTVMSLRVGQTAEKAAERSSAAYIGAIWRRRITATAAIEQNRPSMGAHWGGYSNASHLAVICCSLYRKNESLVTGEWPEGKR